MNQEPRYKYNVINKHGQQEPWTGVFPTLEKAQEWYKNHGKFHEDRGHKIVLVKFIPKSPNELV